jgi:nucleotide-binding universal stress UspA family protein
MLFRAETLQAVGEGAVTTAFRRWRRPTVRAGGTLVTPVGVLAIDTVEVVDPDGITDDDARRAGHGSRAAVLEALGARSGDVYRVSFHLAGADPRVSLREQADLGPDDVAALTRRLGRLDARPTGPWTERVLRLIAAREGVRAGDLAAELGVERLAFKADVRRLKALGLTESLAIGYRLSPRGRAWLER